MQYIWQHRLWLQADMRTVDGRSIHVIDPGQLNTDSGPDFFNAKISIDGHMWAGDVEIHVRASDWHRHHHDGDKAYDSVILHVVDRDDTPIHRSDGSIIPQICMPCAAEFSKSYSALVDRADIDLPCANTISTLSTIHLTDWLTTLSYQRLHDKVDRIHSILERYTGDWESACYITLSRSLGFGTNSDQFERLALSLPLQFIGKHSDSLLSIEALLFGQSGLLNQPNVPMSDPYVSRLSTEYQFLLRKFGLRPPQSLLWKMSRMRPANFPHRRIATLAAMLNGGFRMMSRILTIDSIDSAKKILSPDLTGYWTHHYCFGAPTAHTLSALSNTSIIGLIINAIIPLQYAYATSHGDDDLADQATELLQSLPPERNSIVDIFTHAGIKAPDAFTTQALIQLRRGYCLQRKCLYCRIGHRLLSSKAKRK